jgi:hypothetical protein
MSDLQLLAHLRRGRGGVYMGKFEGFVRGKIEPKLHSSL